MGFSVRSLGRPQDRAAGCLVLPLGIVLLALVLVFFVAFDTSHVQGDSMVPSLLPDDRLLVTRGYDTPNRGDIVLIMAERQGEPVDLVKRVVAIAGDLVEYEGNVASVNGETALPSVAVLEPDIDVSGSLRVPDGSVFVLGDNRPISRDSRFYGPVPLSDIEGRAVLIYTPIDRIGPVDGAPERD